MFGQRFNSSGTKVSTEFQVNSYTTGDQSSGNNGPKITGLTNGGYAVTWMSIGQDSDNSNGIFMQLFDSDGKWVSGGTGNIGSAPVISSTAITSATEDSAYSYTFAATDVDASQTLTLSATSLPSWLSLMLAMVFFLAHQQIHMLEPTMWS